MPERGEIFTQNSIYPVILGHVKSPVCGNLLSSALKMLAKAYLNVYIFTCYFLRILMLNLIMNFV